MKIRIFSLYMLLFLFFTSCDGVAERFATPKERCYKKRYETLKNSPFPDGCKIFALLQGGHDIRTEKGTAEQNSASDAFLKLPLLYCLYEVQSRIDCEKLEY